MSDSHASKSEVKELQRSFDRLEGRVDKGFEHLEKQINRFDKKYAYKESVDALHEKTSYLMKEVGAMKVAHERDHGELNTKVEKVGTRLNVWGAIILAGIPIILFVFDKFL